MDENEAWLAVDAHRLLVADLLEGLTVEQWATPSLCGAWTVRDVGAHLSLAPNAGVLESLGHLVRARGSFDGMIDRATRARARRPVERIVADLREVVGSRRLAPTTTWHDPLLDVLVHSQDLARPLGIEVPLAVEAARESAEWAWRRRFPFRPQRHLAGVRLVATDTDWTRGEGARLEGPVASLLLLSTGRRVALEDPGVGGPGAEVLRRGPGPA